MPFLIRIAFRNMYQHKAKSFIIGGLLILGVIILIIGNAIIDSATNGLRESYIESFTGDVMVSGNSEDPFSIFGTESMELTAEAEVPTIPEYETILSKVQSDPRVLSATSMVTSAALVTADREEDALSDIEEDSENMVFGLVFGVDPSTYFDTFPSIVLEEGRTIHPEESAVMLTREQLDRLNEKYDREFKLGDSLLLTGFTGGMRIREVSLVGVYKRGEVAGEAPFLITDIDTARVLSGLTLRIDENIELSDDQTNLLQRDDLDDLFSDDLFSGMIDDSIGMSADVAYDSAASLLGDTQQRDILNTTDTGSWHFILIRLHDSHDASKVIADMNEYLEASGYEAHAADWKGAAGMVGKLADLVRVIFNICIIIIAIVSVIIIMNTLLISIIERTSEIGTMRALGAQRSFVRRMFLTETLTQTIFFGFLGSAISLLVLFILNSMHIPLENSFAKLLLGGDVLHLVPRFSTILVTIVAVFLVGLLAHLYPVSLALKVQPVKAMQSE